MAGDGLGELLSESLDLLEWRLRRLEFVLGSRSDDGSSTNNAAASPSVLSRLQSLEQSLQQLTLRSEVASELVKLHTRSPELFAKDEPTDNEDEPDSSQKLSMVLAEAPSYSEVASQLRHLNDVPIPPSESFAKSVTLQPRMKEVERRQYLQAMEISELRKKSAAVVLQWHQLFILGQGRCWAEWDLRLRKAERSVRREEVRASRED